ncbi:MAG: recombinase family protein [Elusimicrobia bacterium]|nr:recombinase family protein [Elusimicrobiota bacterium]
MSKTLSARNSEERNTDKVNAVGYIRVSTDLQAENGQGLEIQKEAIQKYCKENPQFNLIKIYEDSGISGAVDQRPGLIELLEDSKVKKFQFVFVSKLDRIARDTFLTLWIEKELKKSEITLVSISEPYRWDDPTQRIFLQLISSFAEFERTRIVERLLSGRLRKINQGRYAGGKPPTGYKSRGGELFIDNQEAQIIERIFRMRFGRKSLYSIAKTLNEEGVPSKYGHKWYPSGIKYILQNQTYWGKIKYGKTEKGIHQKIDLFRRSAPPLTR